MFSGVSEPKAIFPDKDVRCLFASQILNKFVTHIVFALSYLYFEMKSQTKNDLCVSCGCNPCVWDNHSTYVLKNMCHQWKTNNNLEGKDVPNNEC